MIPIPDASIPDSEIVTPPPTFAVLVTNVVTIPVVAVKVVTIPVVAFRVDTVVIPAKTAPPFGSRVIASAGPAVSRSL